MSRDVEPELARARALIRGSVLVAGAQRFAIEEAEVYLRAPGHEDPFVHADPAQTPAGRFYFHRSGESFRGGSFKGMDITLGGPGAIGGILLRSLRRADASLISGPSLAVDALLEAIGCGSVAELDARVAGASIDAPGAPLRVEPAPERSVEPLATARVGLTLKRHEVGDRRPEFLMRRYRLLTDLRGIKKGRAHVIVALHQEGLAPGAIAGETGSPRAHVERLLERYAQGRASGELAALWDRPLTGENLALLHGAWAARFGAERS